MERPKGKTKSTVPKNAEEFLDDHRSDLLELLKMHNNNRVDYNVRKWETVKFFQTIVTASIGVIVGTFFQLSKLDDRDKPLFILILIFLNIVPIAASFYAMRNLKRESKLLFYEELQMFKLIKLMGFDFEVPLKYRFIPRDVNLLLDKWRKTVVSSGKNLPESADAWVKFRMKKHNFMFLFFTLFGVEIIVCVFLATVMSIYLSRCNFSIG